MKVALYARQSKPPKGWKASYAGEHAPGSIGAQRDKLRAWAAAHGHEVTVDEADTATGTNPNRPGWKKVVAALRGGHVQGVAITRTSRAMRNTRHFLEFLEDVLEPRGAQLEVLEQPGASFRGKTDPMGRAFLTIAGAINQLETDLHSEQSNEVMERREDGKLYGPRSEKPAGRPAEYGEGHKFRLRKGQRVHDRAKCRACRGVASGSATAGDKPDESLGFKEEPGTVVRAVQEDASTKGAAK